MPSTRDASPPAVESRPAKPRRHPEFDEFYAAHVRSITAQIYAYTGNLTEAEDLVAEAFCRALARWKQLSAYENPGGWVRRVAWNLATSQFRRRGVVQRFLRRHREEPVEGPGPDRIDLAQALARLSDTHRRAVILRYMAQMTSGEIAELEGVPESTVRSWLSRGKAALAGHLRIEDEEQ
ncbi:sigma-70 family RNA polymerase sigma factor [Glycomyces sp. TRM65418]|uniref:RNA polymerase sigma factor n=1 Tax=Glycomyces sp. TRM65418 TaxID=2867006 RepID=UPI001CE5A8EE|nr:sigma-70 family RNA polymerase sigma factor [Glycomyces sp. TRM65418]MCC3763825.1 sigma-70 family RNA polymerase sigma factor [Glycomyces sp. TRM65418]QZD53531.1 sigma-70 family RNA polymerase sigma factor [Glycomyces sp. TRM65418]